MALLISHFSPSSRQPPAGVRVADSSPASRSLPCPRSVSPHETDRSRGDPLAEPPGLFRVAGDPHRHRAEERLAVCDRDREVVPGDRTDRAGELVQRGQVAAVRGRDVLPGQPEPVKRGTGLGRECVALVESSQEFGVEGRTGRGEPIERSAQVPSARRAEEDTGHRASTLPTR